MFRSWLQRVLVFSLSFATLVALAGCVQEPTSKQQAAGVAEQPAPQQPTAQKPAVEPPVPPKTAGQTPAAPKTATPDPAKPPKSLAVADNEEQWQKFYKEASQQYGLTEEQSKTAGAALQSCLTRAAARRADHKEAIREADRANDQVAREMADTALRVVLDKLGNESIGRIDAVASVEQVEKAARAGFESPRRKNPGPRPEVGFAAPPFELKSPDNKKVSLEGLKGKVVVLQFWASWCGFCKKAMPEMEKFRLTIKDNPDVVLYGINCSQRPTSPEPVAYAKELGCGYQVLTNGDEVSKAYEVQGFPTLYVIGPDGKVIYKERGMQPDPATRLQPVIKKALEDYAKQSQKS